MFRDPPRRTPFSLKVTAILAFSALGGCATAVSENLSAETEAQSVESLEQMIRDRTSEAEMASAGTDINEAWDLVEARDCNGAMPIALAILHNDQDNLDARLVKAECAVIVNDQQSAGLHYEEILVSEREPRALRGLGVLRAREGRYAEAQILLQEAAVSGPEDWRTWNALGYVSDIEGDWEAAADAYQRSAGLAPTRAAPLNNLGLSYLQQGDTASAIDAFNQAINRDPDFTPADENLRMALIFDGQLENALWGISEDRRPVILNNAGVVARAQGNDDLAADLFQRALDESPIFYEKAYNNLRALRHEEQNADQGRQQEQARVDARVEAQSRARELMAAEMPSPQLAPIQVRNISAERTETTEPASSD